MIPEAALKIAGPDALLVTRPPSDVVHVYTGPLTPSGRWVPRGGRAVCRAHTRRLAVLPGRWSSLDHRETGPSRLCARCSARLSSCEGVIDRRAEPIHRSDYRCRYESLTRRDLWAQAVMAENLTEVEHVAHLSLVVLGHAQCDQPLPVAHEHYNAPTLTELLGRIRERFTDSPHQLGESYQALIATGYAQAKAERHAVWQDRQDRIRRIGFVNATT